MQNKTPISLHHIKNINSLEDLAKYNDNIINFAKITTYNNHKDIVQDVYIKLYNMFKKNPKTIIDGGYIATTIRSCMIDQNRKNGKVENVYINDVDIEDVDQDEVNEFEYEENNKWLKYLKALHELEEYQIVIWEYAQQMSILELSKKTNIKYKPLLREFNKIKEILITKLNDGK